MTTSVNQTMLAKGWKCFTVMHWGNWGFHINNHINRLEKLHPKMYFNKSFLPFDTLDGAFCQTNAARQSQKDAALEAVHIIGLNQIAEINPALFFSSTQVMCFHRLELLKSASI